MSALLYIRLIGYTAGTLLQLFWMVVILGYRRQRNFERVFFFLCLALFLFYGGSLLALNAQIHYAEPPALLTAFAKTVMCAGLCMLPPLLVHLHWEYADTREMLRSRALKRVTLVAAYAPALYIALKVYPTLVASPGFDFLIPGNALGRGYGTWLALAMAVSAGWEARFAKRAPDRPQQLFHTLLAAVFVSGAVLAFYLHILGGTLSTNRAVELSTILALLAILPSAVLIYLVQKFNFLQIGRQKNLVYAVSATFLALLYLSLVRRLGGWLEPILPPEATASILLFVLVIFIEPLQRMLGRRLRETAHLEMDRVQQLTAEIQQEARQGNPTALAAFIETRVREAFELAKVKITFLPEGRIEEKHQAVAHAAGRETLTQEKPKFVLIQGAMQRATGFLGNAAGILNAEPHGAAISGETRAALEFLCEQLPAALDLCRLIEEKLRLERELAERERLALVGQMAASISHNLKNPLGSMKTILQVQLENPELPESIREETKMVLEEIGRLSSKLSQLLQFSRPAVRGMNGAGSCNAGTVVEEVTGMLSHEAERRGVDLQVRISDGSARIAASAEALNDIVSNLVVNALEATPRGGHVMVSVANREGTCNLLVEDDGPGIPTALREKILLPFFTTKSQGTGLGLAIVARRAGEFGGKVEWESPVKDGHGTRFKVAMPMQGVKK